MTRRGWGRRCCACARKAWDATDCSSKPSSRPSTDRTTARPMKSPPASPPRSGNPLKAHWPIFTPTISIPTCCTVPIIAAAWDRRIGKCGRPLNRCTQAAGRSSSGSATSRQANSRFCVIGWDKAVRDLCRTHGIVYQGFSLLTANREVFIDPAIRAMAETYGTGVAQVVFRFAMQIGMVPLTGTTNAQHMADDLRADRFTLTPDEIERIETIGI